MANGKPVKEPFLHISKRATLPLWKAILIRVIAIAVGLLICGLICLIVFKQNPFYIYNRIIYGNVGTERKVWLLLQDASLLLLVAIALSPSFKMKFWNLGGNGQILMGALVSVACMFYMGKAKMEDPVIWVCMILGGVLVGALWAVIPAIFKALFKTNESLFTLMMNYIATGLVGYFINVWVPTGSGVLSPLKAGNLPEIGTGMGAKYWLVIICAIAVTAFMYFYIKKSKHGYEVLVVGESENTARYVGINVKKVVIRTLILSGAICGLVGVLIGGGINHTVSESAANNMGFTAIMAAWLAKCDPLLMIISSFGIVFLTKGMKQVQTDIGITNNAVSDMIIGIMYFCIIACEFFITYEVKFRKPQKKQTETVKEGN